MADCCLLARPALSEETYLHQHNLGSQVDRKYSICKFSIDNPVDYGERGSGWKRVVGDLHESKSEIRRLKDLPYCE